MVVLTAQPKKAPPVLAFGVDPTRPARFSLRQARYDAAAQDIDDWAGLAARDGRTLAVLDIGCKSGTLLRHMEKRPHFASISLSGCDLIRYDMFKEHLYREFYLGDLTAGIANIGSAQFDVVVCEQVLEHLPHLDTAIAAIARVLKPGGRAIVGVPIFLPAIAAARRAYVAHTLRRDPGRVWSHIQSFSQKTFLKAMLKDGAFTLDAIRGFRIASEGLLMPLENLRWWWRFNRWLGAQIPWACIEVQAVFQKKL